MKCLHCQHFVFGYGSLICSKSRSITAPETGDKVATPVVVKGLERAWEKRTASGMTAMGVRFVESAECVGVLLPVNNEELMKFDEREQGYERVTLNVEDVETVPFLDDEHYEEEEHTFLEAKDGGKTDDVQIWVYVQEDPLPPSPDNPIAQTYVDVIMRGCLSISKKFAQEFLKTTKGWHPEEFRGPERLTSGTTGDGDEEKVEEVSIWVDDRHDPLYVRADYKYSQENAAELDALLKKHRSRHLLLRQNATMSA